jgi:hypothetical protein
VPSNTKFEYLYRDASNYKSWGSVVFAGPSNDDMQMRLMSAFESGEFFIAQQVRIPEVFLKGWPLDQDDHCWHAFSSMEETDEPANDSHSRKIVEFVDEVERAATEGWMVAKPRRRGARDGQIDAFYKRLAIIEEVQRRVARLSDDEIDTEFAAIENGLEIRVRFVPVPYPGRV